MPPTKLCAESAHRRRLEPTSSGLAADMRTPDRSTRRSLRHGGGRHRQACGRQTQVFPPQRKTAKTLQKHRTNNKLATVGSERDGNRAHNSKHTQTTAGYNTPRLRHSPLPRTPRRINALLNKRYPGDCGPRQRSPKGGLGGPP